MTTKVSNVPEIFAVLYKDDLMPSLLQLKASPNQCSSAQLRHSVMGHGWADCHFFLIIFGDGTDTIMNISGNGTY